MQIPSILSRASLLFQATTAPRQAASPEADVPLTKPTEGVSVKVSAEAESLAKESSAVNRARVEELRQRFAAGTFTVDHLGLARAMLAQS